MSCLEYQYGSIMECSFNGRGWQRHSAAGPAGGPLPLLPACWHAPSLPATIPSAATTASMRRRRAPASSELCLEALPDALLGAILALAGPVEG